MIVEGEIKKEKFSDKKTSAFTLIELLIVIAIIGIIIGIVFISLNSAQSRARDTERASDLQSLNNAILMYYRATGHFPSLPTGCGDNYKYSDKQSSYVNDFSTNNVDAYIKKTSKCYSKEEFILGLVPTYISKLPVDPKPTLKTDDTSVDEICLTCNHRGYIYYHYNTGDVDNPLECYKILVINPESPKLPQYRNLFDPARDGGTDPVFRDGASPTAWSEYSRGCADK